MKTNLCILALLTSAPLCAGKPAADIKIAQPSAQVKAEQPAAIYPMPKAQYYLTHLGVYIAGSVGFLCTWAKIGFATGEIKEVLSRGEVEPRTSDRYGH